MLAPFHPIVVHFTVALLVFGVLLRWTALIPRLSAANPVASTLLLAGTLAAFVAVQSGHDAHGPVERIPGVYPVVKEHEEWGERTRNVFAVVVLAEIAALLLTRFGKPARPALLASSALGALGLVAVFLAGSHGGTLVYSYAGGPGLRTGDPADVGRLLLAGLYQQAQLDRRNGKPEEAAFLADLAARRFPNDVEVQMMRADSLLRDRNDPSGAIQLLQSLNPPKDNRRTRVSHALLHADALEAANQKDGARALLQALLTEFPEDRRLKRRLAAPTK
jgi:uncharacterized membrane protein